MQILIDHIYASLAGVGFIGIVLGWLIQGAISAGKTRRAVVERDVTRTELEQARAEIDGLYMAQRRAQDSENTSRADDAEAKSERLAREAMIKSLGDDLATARSEIEALKRQRTDAVAVTAQTSPSPASAVQAKGPGDASLLWRNRYLESRVRTLEAELETAGSQPDPAEAQTEIAVEVPEAPAQSVTNDGNDGPVDEAAIVNLAKLRWQNEYLRQRLSVMEENAVSVAAREASIEAETRAAEAPAPDQSEAPTPPIAPDVPADEDLTPEAIEQELARLRWRTRFLEGRLAYASGDEDAKPAEPAAVEAEAVTPIAAIAGENASVPTSNAPQTVDEPADGGDDLTLIDGVGSRIAERLNELGIWTFRQVASWSAQQAEWIDHTLGFEGRVERERWIEQAGVLAAGGGHA